jgi:membrane protein DedA with SNARE-associated domain/membrane-associated phospholipid phosphatase
MTLGGAVAGQGAIDLYLLIAIAWFTAWAGDTTSFFLGRRLGRDFVLKNGPRVGISHERFEKVEDYFARHGGKTIFIGRFISLIRAFAPFIAGSSGMRYRNFVPFSILGTGLWATAHILVGYIFSRSIESAAEYAGKGAFVLATLIVTVVAVVYLTRFFRAPENRVKTVRWMEARGWSRWLVEVGRRYRPQLEFLWQRVTPGGTFGLEFTSLVATIAVSVFVLAAYINLVGNDPGPTPGDLTAVDVVEALHSGFLEGLAKVITFLGSGAFTWALAAVGAAILLARRRWAEVGVLLAGMTISSLGITEIKDAVDRPRPEGGLVETAGSSFPSGHATHSVIYVWLAFTIVLRLRPGISRATAIVCGGIALTILVGLSRVYLNVHYLSDVSAGWALGVASFAICALLALVVTQVRQTLRQ